MKHLLPYRDPGLVKGLAEHIRQVVTQRWALMEICGGQTHTIMKYGLNQLLPDNVELLHGPGCPVCVTTMERIDHAIALSQTPGVILASYGDMLRVPGSETSLFGARARGGNVRVVTSPAGAVQLAAEHPDKKVVFFAVGFDTTAPAHALAVKLANAREIDNFYILVSHTRVPPAVRRLLDAPDARIQGFVAPGHVCTVQGYTEYEALCRTYRVPFVVGGFEPVDLMEAVLMLVRQLEAGRCEVENQYVRAVQRTGNLAAQTAVAEVFEVCDRAWRGVGNIENSGLRLRPKYAGRDAETLLPLEITPVSEPKSCQAGAVLMGKMVPSDCPSFGTRCTPETPLGAPMVSSEGACAAYFRYRPMKGLS